MGSRMAARLLEAGFALTVWDREPRTMVALTAAGARGASEPAEIVRDADIVITMLWDDEVAEAIVERTLIPAAREGTTFIEMTTLSPAMQIRLAAAADARGCSFLEAPVTGSKEAAANGELTALVGGPPELLERHRDVLEAMASKILYVGPNGSSGALKLGNNQLIALLAAAWGEALATALAGGVDRRLALDMYASTFSRVAMMKAPTVLERDFSPHFTVDALLKDMHAALRTADAAGRYLPVLRAVLPIFEAAVRDGDGAQDFSIIVDRISSDAPVLEEVTR
ncbi:MAG: NAD(P)-dependent oxidoreductase [Candidatus Eremiobacteraeota bacterium]|nr:NAD(P)-dependent oxidoreductase [Candidatus Eremiobacteraeota bacterium]